MGKFLTLLLLLSLSACQTESRPVASDAGELREVLLETPSGENIKTALAITLKDQEQGLSGIKPSDFDDDQGMLFYYLQEDEKFFWMPDTYFDLDLFYLDRDLKILDIIRKLPHYIGRHNPDLIPRARGVWSRHTLEMKSTSPIAAKLKVGDSLKWKSAIPLKDMDEWAKKLTQP